MKNLFLVLVLLVASLIPCQAYYQGHVSYVPAGTPVPVTLSQTLGSEFSHVGDTFTAQLSGPIYAGSSLVAPPGSQVQGQIVAVNPAGRAGKPGSIDLRLTNIITPNGQRIPLAATVNQSTFSLSAEGGRLGHYAKATAAGAAGGALSGLIGSAISGGRKGRGTAIGTGIGAGVGILGGTIKKGREFVLRQGTTIPFKLDAPIQAANTAPPVQQFRPQLQAPSNPYAPSPPQAQPYAGAPGAFGDPGLGGVPQQPFGQAAPPQGASPFAQPLPNTNPYLYD